MRFLADENVAQTVLDVLRRRGFDVVSIGETQAGVADREVLDRANTDGCILITEDRDFGELVIRQRLGVRGIVLLELDRLSNAAEAAMVAEVISLHDEKLPGNLVVIEPGRIRVRPLPDR